MMQRWRSGVGAAAAVLGLAGAAMAQESPTPDVPAATAAQLAALCRDDDVGFCYGFLTGAAQFYELVTAHAGADMDPFVCPGREVSQAEAAGIFLDWLDDHPQSEGEVAVDAVFRAWTAAFPCE